MTAEWSHPNLSMAVNEPQREVRVMNVDKNGWLTVNEEGFPAVVITPSVRNTGLEVPKPVGIVWHWTGGRGGFPNFAPALVNEIRTYTRGKDRAASWHVLVAKDGRLFQSISFEHGSWHVGKPGRIGSRLTTNINKCTVGVELENAGRLEKIDGKFYCWPFWINPDLAPSQRKPDPKLEVAPDRAVLHDGVWFDDFPAAQEQAAGRLLQALVGWAGWKRDVCSYGHCDFDPTRREDPGLLWTEIILPRVLNRTFGAIVPPPPP